MTKSRRKTLAGPMRGTSRVVSTLSVGPATPSRTPSSGRGSQPDASRTPRPSGALPRRPLPRQRRARTAGVGARGRGSTRSPSRPRRESSCGESIRGPSGGPRQRAAPAPDCRRSPEAGEEIPVRSQYVMNAFARMQPFRRGRRAAGGATRESTPARPGPPPSGASRTDPTNARIAIHVGPSPFRLRPRESALLGNRTGAPRSLRGWRVLAWARPLGLAHVLFPRVESFQQHGIPPRRAGPESSYLRNKPAPMRDTRRHRPHHGQRRSRARRDRRALAVAPGLP